MHFRLIWGDVVLISSSHSQVAKDVSIRLHSQLDSVEKKRSRLEQENEELRVRLQELEVAKQVLQQEIDKVGLKYSNCGTGSTAGSLTCATAGYKYLCYK